jgi:type IV secretory pathway TrbD component
MSRMNQLWLATVMMWLVAVGLTCWNVSTIEAVALARDQNERLRKEMMFHRQYIGPNWSP